MTPIELDAVDLDHAEALRDAATATPEARAKLRAWVEAHESTLPAKWIPEIQATECVLQWCRLRRAEISHRARVYPDLLAALELAAENLQTEFGPYEEQDRVEAVVRSAIAKARRSP